MREKRATVFCDAAKQDVHVEVAAANAGIAQLVRALACQAGDTDSNSVARSKHGPVAGTGTGTCFTHRPL